MAFANAVAWVVRRENRPPDLRAGYDGCLVGYPPCAIGGLPVNDFICAARGRELAAD